MGGYRFPDLSILNCKNIILSPSGIDEVVLGREVFKSDADWEHFKPIIKTEIKNWKKYHKYIKYIHVVTKSEKNDMMEFFDIPEEKFVIIPHGVDHKIFHPPVDKQQTRKNILAKFFLKDNPYFIHVSESNWARKNIFNVFSAFEVSQEHLVEFLQGAEAIILPSKHEGFGLPLLEAMACGTPSITSTTFSPPEVVGDSGILVDPYDVSSISEQISIIGNDKKLRNQLSEKALIRSKNYSWSKTAEGLYNLYQKTFPETNSNFEHDYNISALRTLTTVFETDNSLYNLAVGDLLRLDFSKMINWILQVGIEKESIQDFVLPFEIWYKKQGLKNE
jgi:glycosyltransferase involved in cell wall biosynthesis